MAAQRLVICAKELLLVRAAIGDREAAPEEVGGIRRRSAPAHGLPVHDRERLRAALLAEQAGCRAESRRARGRGAAAGRRATRRGWRRSARTALGARPRCDLRSAPGSRGSSCDMSAWLTGDGWLSQAVAASAGSPSTGACTRAISLMASRAWSTRAPTDLIALQRRRHVLEQQGEPAVRAVVRRSGRREAARRSAVRAPGRSGSRAHRCPSRHRWRGSVGSAAATFITTLSGPASLDVVVGERDAVGLAHLARADRLHRERSDRRRERAPQPVRSQLIGGADDGRRIGGHGGILPGLDSERGRLAGDHGAAASRAAGDVR